MSIKFIKFQPTEYVIKVKKGKTVDKGLGLSFFYNTMNTNVIVVPTTAFDLSFTFDDILTDDFQSVSVQGNVSYVISDCEQASKMLDFSYNDKEISKNSVSIFGFLNNKSFGNVSNISDAKIKIEKQITNVCNVITRKYINSKNIKEAIKSGDQLATVLEQNLKNNEMVIALGLKIISISILGIKAKPETRKALEASTREEILKQQDDAIYKRRNSAIEQERIVKENELNTEIKIAEKAKQKKEKEMETKRLIMERQAEIDAKGLEDKIRLEEKNAELVDLMTENQKKKSDAKAYDTQVILKTFEGVDIEVLKALAITGMDSKSIIAKAFMDIGDKAEKIGVLNVTPDLLDNLSGRR